MPVPWLAALKVIPWGDVIEHAPQVLSAARKLLERQRKTPAPPVAVPNEGPASAPLSLEGLQQQLVGAQQELARLTQTQDQLTQTLAELAEQNARLVNAVELLRVRTRLLITVLVLLVPAVVWLAWR